MEADRSNGNGPKKKRKNRQYHPQEDDSHYINSMRGGHGENRADWDMRREAESMRSAGVVAVEQEQYVSDPTSSNITSREGPPKEYEEIIQNLEGEVRKHIRIEQ